MPEITVNEMNVHYQSQGEGQPLVLIHGAFIFPFRKALDKP